MDEVMIKGEVAGRSERDKFLGGTENHSRMDKLWAGWRARTVVAVNNGSYEKPGREPRIHSTDVDVYVVNNSLPSWQLRVRSLSYLPQARYVITKL